MTQVYRKSSDKPINNIHLYIEKDKPKACNSLHAFYADELVRVLDEMTRTLSPDKLVYMASLTQNNVDAYLSAYGKATDLLNKVNGR